MADKTPHRGGLKPLRRATVEFAAPPAGGPTKEWLSSVLASLRGCPKVDGFAKLKIDAPIDSDLLVVPSAVVEILTAAGVLSEKARITLVEARQNKTLEHDQVRVSISEARPPTWSQGAAGRAIMRDRWSAHRAAKSAVEVSA